MARGTLALAGVGLTQAEVATAAGVSQKTVSAVLRGDRGASDETRRRVIGAIAGLAGIASAAQVEAAMLVAGSER
jgi:DNA-binding LacI/PurR family transcriptional regulator